MPINLSALAPSIEDIAIRRGAILLRSSASGGDFYHAGIVSAMVCEGTAITAPKDENGQERQVGVEIEGKFSLLQTGVNAFETVHSLTSEPLDVIFCSGPAEGTLTEPDALARGEFYFQNQYLVADAMLDYNREESSIPVEFYRRVSVLDARAVSIGG